MLCAFLIFEAFVVCLFVPAFFLERAMTQREAAHKSLSFPDLNYFRVEGIDKTVKNCANLAPQGPVNCVAKSCQARVPATSHRRSTIRTI